MATTDTEKRPLTVTIMKYVTVALCDTVQRSYKLSKRDRLHFGSLDLIEFFSLLKARNKILYLMCVCVCVCRFFFWGGGGGACFLVLCCFGFVGF